MCSTTAAARMSLLIHEKPVWVVLCCGSWHVAINYYVKRTVHGVVMRSVEVHTVGVAYCTLCLHGVDMPGVGM
jgi:hypothetical protein